MTDWTKNNLAHSSTYLSLRILAETKRKFASAGTQKVEQLDFWNDTDSSNMRSAKAKTLAVRLNNLFIDAFKSSFETGYSKTKSIASMQSVLKSKGKTVKDLAATADECYAFYGENV